ncbi:MAG: YheT family hydrolase [Myxococcaceae bacterium]
MPQYTPREPFRPLSVAAGPHAQTILASLIRRPNVGRLRRERWDTPDGDFVDLDFVQGPSDAPWLIVLHGLEGSARSGYVVELLRGAKERGWNAAALNFRSCSGEPNRKIHSYSSGDTVDAKFVIRKLRERAPKSKLFAAGFSLGGNVLLKTLAELGVTRDVDAAAAIGVPFDLDSCAVQIDSAGRMTWLYRSVFVSALKRKALIKAKRFPGQLDVRAIKTAKGIRAFDDVVTAKLYGYRDAGEYYRAAASNAVLPQIRVPTLLIYAKDDPIAPPPEFSREAMENPALHFLQSEQGGHVGFVDGTPWKPGYWAEREALHFFDQRLEQR